MQSCTLLKEAEKNDILPYKLKLYTNTETSFNSEETKIEYSFYNNSQKNVKSLTIVFFCNQEEENDTEDKEYNFEFTINVFVEANNYIEDFICLNEAFNEGSEPSILFEYFYVSCIVYEDDSEWNDPFGRYMFSCLQP
ncbi:hypothetical protein [Treponema sp. C6A8]|uniref:hypothetical protein n=1 Tax=Treponema sp. C6A8 TaxID=1410609 RepID=UPI0004828C70|nr:hypothetical protein [Treponema sp. C6A8]